jgi:hypothetical protein
MLDDAFKLTLDVLFPPIKLQPKKSENQEDVTTTSSLPNGER